jgi:putative toxin-antitoxin system antitoxin component (TIGR02293 family)
MSLASPAPKDLSIRERLEIASQGTIPVYDGSSVFNLTKLGLSMDEIYRFVIPRRTLARRISNGEPLTVEENDNALRIVTVLTHANRVFADSAVALDWLRTPNTALGGIVPIDLLESETGARLVEQSLHQIDFGIYV